MALLTTAGSGYVLWFNPLAYFTHTLISCARAVCARGRFVRQQKTKPIFKLGRFNRAIYNTELNKIITSRDVFESEHLQSKNKTIPVRTNNRFML